MVTYKQDWQASNTQTPHSWKEAHGALLAHRLVLLYCLIYSAAQIQWSCNIAGRGLSLPYGSNTRAPA